MCVCMVVALTSITLIDTFLIIVIIIILVIIIITVIMIMIISLSFSIALIQFDVSPVFPVAVIFLSYI